MQQAPVVRFGVLGPVRAWRAGEELDPGPRQQRLILAILLARTGNWVSMDELIHLLWAEDMPPSAVNVIHRHVGQLRRLLQPTLPARAAGCWLIREGAGYRLKVTAGSADLLEFRERVRQATEQDDADAVATYGKAFELWRGPCADGLGPSPVFTAVDNEVVAAANDMAKVALRCGRGQDVLPVLRRIVPSDPLNERLHARLMVVLAATGHQAEALNVYQAITERLADDLGIDPGPDLRSAHAQVLRQDHKVVEPRASLPMVRPAQLPLDLPSFGGRQAELTRMRDAVLAEGMPVPIVTVDGMPGAGKTTIAVRLAHDLVERYPDGQLYVNLRGFDPSGLAVDPTAALLGFLTALGVPGELVPPDLPAQSALFRSHLAGKRMLVVLDNVRDIDQVLPLLPGASSCLVIVTSRDRLVGLIATEGARSFTLNPVPADEAREILELRLGALRSREQPEAVDQMVAVCQGLPLALAIVAARAETYPDVPLSEIAAELMSGLDALSQDSVRGVRAVFSWSYQALSPMAARLFRLLSYHWGPDTAAPACASLLGVPVRQAQATIAELSRTRLVTEHVPGRFLLHDLVRAYGMELSQELDSPAERAEAVHRMLAHYLHSAYAANLMTRPHQLTELEPAPPGVIPEPCRDVAAAYRWLTNEYRVLLMGIGQAIESGHARIAWQLAVSLYNFQHHNGLLRDWAVASQAALTAADEAGDGLGRVRARRSLAGAYFMFGDGQMALKLLHETQALIDELGLPAESAFVSRGIAETLGEGLPNLPQDNIEATRYFRLAITQYREIGHVQGVAYCMEGLAKCHALQGEYAEAVELLTDALELHRSISDSVGEGYVFVRLADIDLRLGNLDNAVTRLDQAIALHVRGRHRFMTIEDLELLGDVRLARNEPDAARAAWTQALDLCVEFGATAKIITLQSRLAQLTG